MSEFHTAVAGAQALWALASVCKSTVPARKEAAAKIVSSAKKHHAEHAGAAGQRLFQQFAAFADQLIRLSFHNTGDAHTKKPAHAPDPNPALILSAVPRTWSVRVDVVRAAIVGGSCGSALQQTTFSFEAAVLALLTQLDVKVYIRIDMKLCRHITNHQQRKQSRAPSRPAGGAQFGSSIRSLSFGCQAAGVWSKHSCLC